MDQPGSPEKQVLPPARTMFANSDLRKSLSHLNHTQASFSISPIPVV